MNAVDVLYLSQEDVIDLGIPLAALTHALEESLVEHARRTVEMPPKPGIHPSYENTFIHAMPAYLRGMDACGLKWVAGFPRNPAQGLPNVSGVIVLNDTHTGIPLAIMDCRYITTVRTALVSAIAARLCARPEASVMAIVGCGLQGRYHARAIVDALPSIATIRFIDPVAASMRRFAEETAAFFGGRLQPCATDEQCVAGADLVVTCTPGDRPVVSDEWFVAGATGIGIEGGCAYEEKALHGADKLVVDDVPQARHFETQGDFPGGLPPVYAELGQLVAGMRPARESATERILITPLGLAIEDIAIARLVHERAVAASAGTRLPLMRRDL